MEKEDKISLRQFLVLLTVSLLSPLIKMIPGKQAEVVGTGGWLAGLAVLLPALAVIWLVSALGRGLPEDAGLGEAMCLCLGKGVGRAFCGVYGLWLLLLGCAMLRFCVERFTSTLYPDTGLGLFLLMILGLEWWLGKQKLAVLARVGQIFFFAIVLTMGVILVMGVGNVRIYNVWPVWTQDLPRIAQASVPILETMGGGIGFMFFFGQVTDRRDGRRIAMQWTTGLCLLLTALGFIVMGVFGPVLAERLQVPFFSLAKEVQVEGAVERAESLVVAMWLFADLVLFGVLLHSSRCAFSQLIGEKQSPISSALLLVALPGAYLVAGSAFAMEEAYRTWAVKTGMILFYLVPLAVMLIGKCRKTI